MPQIQSIRTIPENQEPNSVDRFFSRLGQQYKERQDQDTIGRILGEYEQNREDANAWEHAQIELEKSNISPTRRLQAQDSLNKIQNTISTRDKALNARFNKGILNESERKARKDHLLSAGYPPEVADYYLDAPPGVQATIAREHKELVDRGIRKPLVSSPQENMPPQIDNNGDRVEVEDVSSPTDERPIFVDDGETDQEKTAAHYGLPIEDEDWPEPIVPANMTAGERVKWENNNEKENNKELKAVIDKKKAYRTNDTLIRSMTQINDGGYLPKGIEKMLIIDPDTGDIRPNAQLLKIQNPQTELYVKNLKQWLKGAKEFFGARVTNFDVTSFMAQLPGLLNSEQGRRLILKQMKYVNDLESIYTNTESEALKKYGRTANYNQIIDTVEKKVGEREKDLLGKIDNLVLASRDMELMAQNPEKFRNHVLMQTPEGNFRAVPKEKVEYLKTKKWRDF